MRQVSKVKIFDNKVTPVGGCYVKRTVYPKSLRGLMDKSVYLNVIVDN